MKLLAISLPNHDTNVTYFDGSKITHLKLERLQCIKRYNTSHFFLIEDQLKRYLNLEFKDVDEIVFDWDTVTADNYGLRSKEINPEYFDFFDSYYENNQLYFEMDDGFKKIIGVNHDKVYHITHHYAHSLCGWMLMNRRPDISFVLDGYGDNRSWSIFRKDELVEKGIVSNGSIGNQMEQVGEYLNIKSANLVDHAGKVMGLQSYGNIDYDYLNILRTYDIKDINTIFSTDLWARYRGDYLVNILSPLDWIKTVHFRVGELLVDFFKQYAKKDELIFYSGGVAQNVIWNTELKKEFPNLIIPPHSGDEGTSFGGIEFLRIKNNLPQFELPNFPYVQTDQSPTTNPSDDTIRIAAELLAEGKAIAWYQGNGEIGPRALGNRSILLDPRIPNGKQRMNQIKRRENYRPFGASILEEYAKEYFDMDWNDEYMLYVGKTVKKDLQSITHVDGTCRVQTVGDKNPVFRKLLEQFYDITGCPVLLNTSMNLAGMPMAGFSGIPKQLFYITNIDAVFSGDEWMIK